MWHTSQFVHRGLDGPATGRKQSWNETIRGIDSWMVGSIVERGRFQGNTSDSDRDVDGTCTVQRGPFSCQFLSWNLLAWYP